MDLIELTPDYEVTEFDCGDEQLNKFLFEDAKPSLALRVANKGSCKLPTEQTIP